MQAVAAAISKRLQQILEQLRAFPYIAMKFTPGNLSLHVMEFLMKNAGGLPLTF